MPTRKKKKEYLNSLNAISVANRGLNSAFSQSHGQLYKDANGKWQEGDMAGTSKRGRMSASTTSTKAGGSTWTFTEKDNDGNKIRQSGRSRIATRRQRYYDVRVGLGLAGG